MNQFPAKFCGISSHVLKPNLRLLLSLVKTVEDLELLSDLDPVERKIKGRSDITQTVNLWQKPGCCWLKDQRITIMELQAKVIKIS